MHVPVGTQIPAGSIIRIGPHPDLTDTALHVEFRVTSPIVWVQGAKIKSMPVLKRPNGWSQKTVSHDISLEFDEIVSFAGENQQVGKSLLERIDD